MGEGEGLEAMREVMPGGVSSPVRAWQGVGIEPPFGAGRSGGSYFF